LGSSRAREREFGELAEELVSECMSALSNFRFFDFSNFQFFEFSFFQMFESDSYFLMLTMLPDSSYSPWSFRDRGG
jgi:hypothetical protein